MRTQTCTHTHAHTGTHAHAGTRTHTQAHARTHTLRGADNGGVADTKLQDLSWSEARGGRDDLICSLSTCAGGRLGPGSSAQSHRRGPSPQELRVWRAQVLRPRNVGKAWLGLRPQGPPRLGCAFHGGWTGEDLLLSSPGATAGPSVDGGPELLPAARALWGTWPYGPLHGTDHSWQLKSAGSALTWQDLAFQPEEAKELHGRDGAG
ncbi:uncharacterized protein LOC119509092 isoform X1 [Choloepus didactylus]|uniref:uncharacterized protein LOC119509092 isoform X1 n=1 Tax=Choloepus didactylus TaxID=27675 RepID=UPI0018A06940|nr:uncharacterized protein LOC119509092 isoform X1 [Choloepus didactylus]